jgi:hypothetical protein
MNFEDFFIHISLKLKVITTFVKKNSAKSYSLGSRADAMQEIDCGNTAIFTIAMHVMWRHPLPPLTVISFCISLF